MISSSPAGRHSDQNQENNSMNFRKLNLKRIVGLLAFSALLVGSTDVQARGPGRGCGNFLSQIELTDAQQEQIDDLRQGARDQRAQIFENEDLTREERRTALQNIHEGTQDAIEGVLTTEQLEQIEELKAEQAAARLDRRIERLTEVLTLSEDQADNIRGIFVDARPDMEAIMNSDATHEEKRDQLKVIKDEIKADIIANAGLSEEQIETFENMKQRRNRRGNARRNRRG